MYKHRQKFSARAWLAEQKNSFHWYQPNQKFSPLRWNKSRKRSVRAIDCNNSAQYNYYNAQNNLNIRKEKEKHRMLLTRQTKEQQLEMNEKYNQLKIANGWVTWVLQSMGWSKKTKEKKVDCVMKTLIRVIFPHLNSAIYLTTIHQRRVATFFF